MPTPFNDVSKETLNQLISDVLLTGLSMVLVELTTSPFGPEFKATVIPRSQRDDDSLVFRSSR